MPAWVLDMVGVFVGAILGALFGYGMSRLQAWQETHALRKVLLRTLAEQLHPIPDSEPAFDPSMLLTRGLINVSAAGELLSGATLNAQQDAKLIRLLHLWQSFEASHNELVRITNQATVTRSIPQEHRAAWHNSLNNSLGLLTALRGDVLNELPPEYRQPSWPHDPAKEQALIFGQSIS